MEKRIVDSKIHGFGYAGNTTGNLNISSFSLAAGATRSFTIDLSIDTDDTTSLTRIKFSGVGNTALNNIWAMVYGALSFRNIGPPSYDVGVVINRTSSGQQVVIQFYNPTGASVTVPNITVDVESYFYSAPW